MNVLIIEDESAAAQRIADLLLGIEPAANIVATLESVAQALGWLQINTVPDLIISDVQLADGTCFDIFGTITVSSPIIFTTAYDAYTLKAFKLNSIDYLLKPIDVEELKAALQKFHALKPTQAQDINTRMLEMMQQLSGNKYRSRFLIREADKLSTIIVDKVSWLRADNKLVWLCTSAGQTHFISEPLDELEKALDPSFFFRLNRQYIARIDAIEQINNHFHGKLKVNLKHAKDDDILVSRERATAFKDWLNK